MDSYFESGLFSDDDEDEPQYTFREIELSFCILELQPRNKKSKNGFFQFVNKCEKREADTDSANGSISTSSSSSSLSSMQSTISNNTDEYKISNPGEQDKNSKEFQNCDDEKCEKCEEFRPWYDFHDKPQESFHCQEDHHHHHHSIAEFISYYLIHLPERIRDKHRFNIHSVPREQLKKIYVY